MRHDESVELFHANRSQVRHNGAIAAVRTRPERGARVVEQRVPRRSHHRGQALPHVQHDDLDIARPDRGRRHRKQRQQPDRAQPARRHAAGSEQPGQRRDGHDHGPRRRRMLLPHRVGKRREPIQHDHASVHHQVRGPQYQVDRQHGPEQRQRRDDQAHDRDRNGIGER